MKQFFKMFFASLLAMVVAGVIIFGFIIGMIVKTATSITDDGETTVKAGSVLEIDLSKRFHEQGENNSLVTILGNSGSFNAGLYDATAAIRRAKTDNSIKGIIIKLNPSPNGWATLQQLRAALADFKTSKKFVYAYGENISQGAYYIGSVADSVYVNPLGDVELKGFATILAFFKGTLDKLELQPEIFYAGKFKSATEPFRSDRMSEPNKAQIAEFQADFWSVFTAAVSEHTHASADSVNQWAQTGAIEFPEDALQRRIVDGLLYWDQVEERIRAKTGTKQKNKIEYVTLDEYAEGNASDRKVKDNKIAVLFAEGTIIDGKSNDDYQIASEDIIETIRKVRDNDKIKAVVLRVNSPGGSALASEVILRELQLLKAKKPLIVSMGDVAASGGYYIACQADSIFAQPNTITGSIGVFTMLFNTDKLMKNKLGITFDGVKNAPYADFPTGTRPLTADEGRRMQASVDRIYELFKNRVSTGRKIGMTEVDSMAQGRIWTGTDAYALHLVDGLGGLDRALQSAAAKAKLSEYQVVTYPEPVDKFQSMIRRLQGNSAAAAVVQTAVQQELGEDYEWYKKIKALRNMNGAIQMLMPFSLDVR